MKLKLIKSGTAGFDKLLSGGIPCGSAVLVQSDATSTGAEKFCIQFIAECLKDNGGALVVCGSRHYGELKAELVDILGFVPEGLQKRLKIVDWYTYKFERIRGGLEEEGLVTKCSIDLTNVGIAINNNVKKLRKLRRIGGCTHLRAYVDMLDNALKIFPPLKVYEFTEAMLGILQKNDFTTVFILRG